MNSCLSHLATHRRLPGEKTLTPGLFSTARWSDFLLSEAVADAGGRPELNSVIGALPVCREAEDGRRTLQEMCNYGVRFHRRRNGA